MQKIILAAQLSLLVFLVLRAVLWLQDHAVSRHILDNLSIAAVLLLVFLLVLASPVTKKEVTFQKGVAAVVVCLGLGSMAIAVAGILAIFLF